MNIRHGLARRLRRGSALAAALTLCGAGIAVASNVVKGADYAGTYTGKQGDSITFKVSANGKRVTDLTASTPFKCQGGCGGVSNGTGGTAAIKDGKFKATLDLRGPGGSTKVVGTDKVTGTFEKNGEAKGTVTSHFNSGSAGETVHWTAVSGAQ